MTKLKMQERSTIIATLIIAISFAIRIHYALTYHLNPDEGFHYLFSHQPSLEDVRNETLSPIHTYPPLYVFLLHIVLEFSDTEFALRLPALFFGTVFLAFAYLWVRRLFNETAALAALLILAFSPGILSIGFEVRNYALLLAALTITLYSLHRLFVEQSPKWMNRAMLALYVAILTSYSAVWICISLGIYMCLRIYRKELAPTLIRRWIYFQAGALAIYAWLYATHISILRGSASEAALKRFLRDSYFWPDSDSIFTYIPRQTVAVCQYFFELPALSVLAALVFVGSLIWLAAGKDSNIKDSQLTAVLLGLPILLGCLLGVAGLYPFGNSRHSVIFQPYLAALLGYPIAALTRNRTTVLLAATAIAVPLWAFTTYPTAPYLPRPDDTIANMEHAVEHLRTLPKGVTIFADHASFIELGYYLDRETYSPYHNRTPGIVEFRYSGYRVLSPAALWSLSPTDFIPAFNETLERYRIPPNEIWIFDAGPDNLGAELTAKFPKLNTPGMKWFGPRISIFQVSN